MDNTREITPSEGSEAARGTRPLGDTTLGHDLGDTTMAHRMAQLAGKVHLGTPALARIQSAVIFGSIGSGLLACALGSIVYDIGRAFAAW